MLIKNDLDTTASIILISLIKYATWHQYYISIKKKNAIVSVAVFLLLLILKVELNFTRMNVLKFIINNQFFSFNVQAYYSRTFNK